jgi:hypothetical protein
MFKYIQVDVIQESQIHVYQILPDRHDYQVEVVQIEVSETHKGHI